LWKGEKRGRRKERVIKYLIGIGIWRLPERRSSAKKELSQNLFPYIIHDFDIEKKRMTLKALLGLKNLEGGKEELGVLSVSIKPFQCHLKP
jgi:hypothetical protein